MTTTNATTATTTATTTTTDAAKRPGTTILTEAQRTKAIATIAAARADAVIGNDPAVPAALRAWVVAAITDGTTGLVVLADRTLITELTPLILAKGGF